MGIFDRFRGHGRHRAGNAPGTIDRESDERADGSYDDTTTYEDTGTHEDKATPPQRRQPHQRLRADRDEESDRPYP